MVNCRQCKYCLVEAATGKRFCNRLDCYCHNVENTSDNAVTLGRLEPDEDNCPGMELIVEG